MKIAIIHPDPVAKMTFPLMHDGLKAALNIVSKKHEVKLFLGNDKPDNSFDWIIPWGVCSMPFNQTLDNYKAKKALLCAGHPFDIENIDKFEHIFVESPYMYREMLPFAKSISIAFGTDTDFFKPSQEEKMFDVFYPATFSNNWKRQQIFAKAVRGYKAMACGLIQPDGADGYTKCVEEGVFVMGGLIPTILISRLYQISKVVAITAWHGSERSALEALASNVPLVIARDNELTCSLVKDNAIVVEPNPDAIRAGIELALQKTNVNTRDWVIENYSAEKYAANILEILEK